MSEEFKTKVKSVIAKLKTIKNIEIIVGVVIIAIVALIYSTVTSNQGKAKTASPAKTDAVTSNLADGLESRLEQILSQIDGAGQVKVMITFESSAEIVAASTTNRHSNTSSSSGGGSTTTVTETISPIIVTNNGKSEIIILKQIMPEIRGVIIVAEGASNIRVRSELRRAAQTALGVNASSIEIFAKKINK
jgi:hypothetical protein